MRFRGKGYTNEQLIAFSQIIEEEPANRMPIGSINRFTPAARQKLDEIALAITDNLAEARKRNNDPIVTDGYSGRQTNRR